MLVLNLVLIVQAKLGGRLSTNNFRFYSQDNEVQFIPIPPKPKNSPMTEHQKEMAKEKSYIPALYEDLSQSQSQSDSISLLSPKK